MATVVEERGTAPRHVLIVCTGNTCRSPLAEVMLRRLLEERGMGHTVTVASAGVGTVDGAPAAEGARRVAAERGLRLDGHRTRSVDEDVLARADLILTMEVSHKERLLRRYPRYAHAVYTLKEYAGVGGSPDVDDPYGGDDARYRAAADEIRALLERVVDRWVQEGFHAGAND